MRVRYGDLRASEHRKLAALDARIEAFFEAVRASPLDQVSLRCAAAQVHRGLTAESGTDASLIVRAVSRELVPIAERVVARAPTGCSVSSRRPPCGLETALAAVRRQWSLDLRRARFRAGFARGHLIEVVVYLPGGSGSAPEQSAAEQLIWSVLGDSIADAWIGRVRVAPEPRGGPLRVVGNTEASNDAERFGLEYLAETVGAAVRGLCAALPSEPSWARSGQADWVLLEAEPEPPGGCEAQDDLMIAATCEPELLKSFLSGEPFSSVRFSCHGELHFYLKFASTGELERRLAQRSLLEDALDSRLKLARSGSVTGGGIGVRHSYVNFVLSECHAGFEIVREVAQSASLSTQSWILAFDDELAAEWLEIWPEAPAPPGFSL